MGQLRQGHLVHVAVAHVLGFGGLGQVHRVLREGQHVQPAGLLVHLLARAVLQQHGRAARAFDQPPPLGQDGGAAVLLPAVLHQDAAQRAVHIARADIDGEVVGHGGEHALLQQEGGDAVADLELVFAEGGVAAGHDPDIEQEAAGHGHAGNREAGAGEGQRGHAGRAHHGQLPVPGEAAVDELHDDEGGDRQDDGHEVRDQQPGELQEHPEREPPVDHEFDEAERLRQPDQRHQRAGRRDEGDQQLAEDVAVDAVDDGAGHCGRAGVLVGAKAAHLSPPHLPRRKPRRRFSNIPVYNGPTTPPYSTCTNTPGTGARRGRKKASTQVAAINPALHDRATDRARS